VIGPGTAGTDEMEGGEKSENVGVDGAETGSDNGGDGGNVLWICGYELVGVREGK
jgi:hypothetical protein